MCAMSRTTRGRACGTAISVEQLRGTSVKPSLRAASAGNSALRSWVAVNRTLMKSSVVNWLRRMTSSISSAVASNMRSRSLASTWTAPRIARTATFRPPDIPGLHPCGSVELADFLRGQGPDGAALQVVEPDRSDLGAGQVRHGVTHRFHEAAHNVLPPLMQSDLDQGFRLDVVDHPERVHFDESVVQFDPFADLADDVAGDGSGHFRKIGLGHFIAGVGEPVGELPIVGEQDQ